MGRSLKRRCLPMATSAVMDYTGKMVSGDPTTDLTWRV